VAIFKFTYLQDAEDQNCRFQEMNSVLPLDYFHHNFSNSGEESLTVPGIFMEKATTNSIIPKVTRSALSSGPTTFEPFMRLPPELRLMIWDFSKYDPRIISAGLRSSQDRYCLNSLTHQPSPALPAGLQVHQESRYHFLKTYQALFYCFLRSQMTIYIDPKVDILFHYSTSDYKPSVDRAIIERVTWKYSPRPPWPTASFDWHDIALYPALKEVVIQLSHDPHSEWNRGNWSEEKRWTKISTGKPDPMRNARASGAKTRDVFSGVMVMFSDALSNDFVFY
jgi:hypothetical protein